MDANVIDECVVSTTIRYTHFHWLIYNLKRSRQEVTKTCLERGCVRYFHEQQKQTKSEMKGLILFRLHFHLHFGCLGNSIPRLNNDPKYTSSQVSYNSVKMKSTSVIPMPNILYVYQKQEQKITNIH